MLISISILAYQHSRSADVEFLIASMLKINPAERPDIFEVLDMIDGGIKSNPGSIILSSSDTSCTEFEALHNTAMNLKPEYSSSSDSVFEWIGISSWVFANEYQSYKRVTDLRTNPLSAILVTRVWVIFKSLRYFNRENEFTSFQMSSSHFQFWK